MNTPNASRNPGTTAEVPKKHTHLEMLVEGAQKNERRLQNLQEFALAILTKIRGNSVPTVGTPRPESIGGTLGQLEDSLCNAGDYISVIESALNELDATI